MFWLLVSVAIAGVCSFFAGCSPQKKLDKAEQRVRANPTVAAEICHDLFPVKPQTDSAAYVRAIDSIRQLQAEYVAMTYGDSLNAQMLMDEIQRLNLARPDCDTVAQRYEALVARERARARKAELTAQSILEAAKRIPAIRDTVIDEAESIYLFDQLGNCSRAVDRVTAENKELRDSRKGKIAVDWWWILIIIIGLGGSYVAGKLIK